MTYQQTLDWMFAQLPMYQQKGKIAFNTKLDGILEFSEYLGNPHKTFKSIHVAGTNGKGSSSHMLASILQEAGYKVGLYTSPHLKDFRERIRINGKPVTKGFVTKFISENRDFFDNRHLSFFEMTVGMAFRYFSEQQVDIAVVEVGLGGRLDSTNIITPEISLITNIGFDHMEMLGDTLPKIAFEKAGIIKTNVPVVVSEYHDETAPVFMEIAKERNAKLIFAEKEISETYQTSLKGKYQTKNIKGVLAVIATLPSFNVQNENIAKGLHKVIENTGLMGRWQQLGQAPKIICDTAHNKEGLQLVLDQLMEEVYDTLHIVLGFVKEKDLNSILPMFPVHAVYYFCQPNISRGLPANLLKEMAEDYNLHGTVFDTVSKAYAAAKQAATKSDFIFVGGSTFVVAEVV
ncbi:MULTISPECIES: bifunctional folylpolyglutamate synthase/dihydrofolate synthase [Maribacter]|uniref:Dihydrofolate synthase/folylpolyglutamate synthase n=1 Tax=Maribacter flavus TaxID=1658664 RepID=A0ABU7IKW3_9FLAO|nr:MULTISPECIES: folylpolyglutamate synthase/dihydrofolate synthase family protein [Maribacter]MDC6406363.1 bifunctional folylpolyglutamate synthase/dihydrofolate synthase [Maribacter sp. PR66]MEE1973483.1 folylpolyglutamate synthase/dihydrofolate synthase family protein [Maribacter flavus]